MELKEIQNRYGIKKNDDLIKHLFYLVKHEEKLKDKNWRDNLYMATKLDKAIKSLTKIAERETCWSCKYYIGDPVGDYCKPPVNCNRSKWDQFEPTSKHQIIARKTLGEILE